MEPYFDLTSLQCLIPEYNLRMKDNVIAEGFPGFSYLLRIKSLINTWAYSIHINPILSSSPSNLGQSFPIPALHHPPSHTVSFEFVTKALALPYSSIFFHLSPPKSYHYRLFFPLFYCTHIC